MFSFASIAGAKFTDQTSVKYTEAVEVMNKIGIIDGLPDGSFKPADLLTRAQMAKMVAFLLNSGVDVNAMYSSANTFSDCSSNWAKGYIAYTNKTGIVSGVGNGKFDPNGNVTGVQAAKMLLVALGYDPKVEVYTGANWTVNVMNDAKAAGLTKDLPTSMDYSAKLTREQAAQMMFNALLADVVEYSSTGADIIIGDANINIGATKATSVVNKTSTFVTSGAATQPDGFVVGTSGTQQFAEKYFTDLTGNYAASSNGHTGRMFSFKGLAFSTFVATDRVLVKSTNGATLTNLVLKGNKDYAGFDTFATRVELYIDGVRQINDTTTATGEIPADGFYIAGDIAGMKTAVNPYCKIGAVVQLIGDANSNITTVVVNTYRLSKVTSTAAAKTDGTEATVSITGIGAIKESDVQGKFADFAKDDYVMYTKVGATAYEIYEATSFTGKMSKYTSANNTMVVGGTTYTASAAINNLGLTQAQSQGSYGSGESTFYVDANGYVVAVDGVAAASKYAVIDAIQGVNTDLSNASVYASARLIMPDGTTQIVKVNKIGGTPVVIGTAAWATAQVDAAMASNNTEYQGNVITYTTDSKGFYQLSNQNKWGVGTVTKGLASVAGGAVANNDTIYVYKTTNGSDVTYKSYTGYKNAPTALATPGTTNVASIVKDGYAALVFVSATSTAVGDSSSSVIVFLDSAFAIVNKDETTRVYEYKAAVDGKEGTYTASNPLTFAVGNLYDVNVDADGYISDKSGDNSFTSEPPATNFTLTNAVADAKNGTVKVNTAVNGNSALTFDGTESVFLINTDNNTCVAGDASMILNGTYFYVKAKDTTGADGAAMKNVYIRTSNTAAAVPTALGLAKTSGSGTVAQGNLLTAAGSITGASDADTYTVTALPVTGTTVSVTISGKGTTVSGANAATYTVGTADIGSVLTVTVFTYADGKLPVTNTYTISVA